MDAVERRDEEEAFLVDEAQTQEEDSPRHVPSSLGLRAGQAPRRLQGLVALLVVAALLAAGAVAFSRAGRGPGQSTGIPSELFTEDLPDLAPCVASGENCWESQCCSDAATKCYEKNFGWAICRESCEPGIHMGDAKVLQTPWTCNVLVRDDGALSRAQYASGSDSATVGDLIGAGNDNRKTSISSATTTSLETTITTSSTMTNTKTTTATRTTTGTITHRRTTTSTGTRTTTRKASVTSTTATTTMAEACPTGLGEACELTRCCSDPKAKCYQKHSRWAVCKEHCIPGVNKSEPLEAQTPWSCEVLELRSPTSGTTATTTRTSRASTRTSASEDSTSSTNSTGSEEAPSTAYEGEGECSRNGEDCRKSRCCSDPADTCFETDVLWAVCRTDCIPGIDGVEYCLALTRPSELEALKAQALEEKEKAAQVAQAEEEAEIPLVECGNSFKECTTSKCCKDAAMTCYEKDAGWAACLPGCEVGVHAEEPQYLQTPWSCKELETCSAPKADCSVSRCCLDPNDKCFQKDEYWAACYPSCEVGVHHDEPEAFQTPWSCTVLSPESSQPSSRTPELGPTLYCFTFILPSSLQVALLRSQIEKGVGIFQCNEYEVYSTDQVELIASPSISTVALEGVLSAEVQSRETFFRLWKQMMAHTRFKLYDWTVKVDADAVFLPKRLRQRTEKSDPHEALYLNNCDAGLRDALEVISVGGMNAFNDGIDLCKETLQVARGHDSGVDIMLSGCLDFLKVKRVDDFTMLYEATTAEEPMCVGKQVAFHPLDNPHKYFTCLAQTAL